MIGSIIVCDHNEGVKLRILPTHLVLQSAAIARLTIPSDGARPAGAPAARRGRAAAGKAGQTGTGQPSGKVRS